MGRQVWRGRVVTPDGVLEGGVVVAEDGIIQAVSADGRYRPTLDVGRSYIVPGFIDVHIHGLAGADAMRADQGDVARMAVKLARHGVTGFLPTTVSAQMDRTLAVVRAIRAYASDGQLRADRQRAKVLGIHLEGPWISKEAKGAHDERHIQPPQWSAVQRLLDAGGGWVRIVSLAPEQPGADEVIRGLAERGVAASIAHTAATYDQAERAIRLGACQVTHCFNAMTGLHHRRPGALTAVLLHDSVRAELIADGVHVHPAAIRLLVRVKGRHRVMLVSDAIAAAGLADGEYSLGELPVRVQGGQARLLDGTLAGSTLTLDQAVRYLVQVCAIPLVDAVCMASTTPAEAIGWGHRKGQIRPGFDADLVVLNEALQPVRTEVAVGADEEAER